MKSREEQQAMVDKLKTTWTAFGGLTEEEQEFLKANCKDVIKLFDNGTAPFNNPDCFSISLVYRLSPDFTLPEPKRWLYSNKNNKLYKYDGTSDWPDNCVEVQSPYDLAYVRSVIERKDLDLSEWEYRLIKSTDTFIAKDGREYSAWDVEKPEYAFIRKSKPEAVAVQKEFDVYVSADKKLRVKDWIIDNTPTLSEAWHYAIDRGMGMEFVLQKKNGKFVTTYFPNWFDDDGTPAKCIKVRCSVKEDWK